MASQRNQFLAAVMWLIPFVNLYLFYKWNSGIKSKWKAENSPILRTIGLFFTFINIYVIYLTLKDINSKAPKKAEALSPWWALAPLIPIITSILSVFEAAIANTMFLGFLSLALSVAINLYMGYKIQDSLNKSGVSS